MKEFMASSGLNESSSDHYESQRRVAGPSNHPQTSATGDASLHAEGTVPGAQPPVEIAGIKQRRSQESAAGVAAVVETMRFAWGRMGVTRGTQALLQGTRRMVLTVKAAPGQARTSDDTSPNFARAEPKRFLTRELAGE